MVRAIEVLGVSERRACKVIEKPRSTQRCELPPSDEERSLTEDIVELARGFGRYGYRRITAPLRNRGWRVNHKRVERIWRREGLKVPSKQPQEREAVAQRRVVHQTEAREA